MRNATWEQIALNWTAERACPFCDREIAHPGGRGGVALDKRMTCGSAECQYALRRSRWNKGIDPTHKGRFTSAPWRTFAKTCSVCGEQFQARSGRRLRCPDCCKCHWCSKPLTKVDTKVRFCDHSCASQWAIRNTGAGAALMAGQRSGEDHWNWQGGITPLREAAMSRLDYKLWRFGVFKRDAFRCVLCGGGKIHAHHIQPWRSHQERRYDVDNGITLCEPCHMAIGRGEAAFEDRFLAYTATKRAVALTPEEVAHFEPFFTVCDYCNKELLRPRRARKTKFHFCGNECRRTFHKTVGYKRRVPEHAGQPPGGNQQPIGARQ